MRHKVTSALSGQLLKAVGSKITKARSSIGMSQTELARRCHVTRSQMCKHESGSAEMSLSRLCDICAVLKITVKEVFNSNGQE